MRYRVEIRETLSRMVYVDAPNPDSAKKIAEQQYKSEKVVLNAEDFVEVAYLVSEDKLSPQRECEEK